MNVSELIDRYCQAWTESDPTLRMTLLASVWETEATYTDPTVHTMGSAELSAHIGRVQARHPGAKVLRTSVVDVHHDIARFAWHVLQADGTAQLEGVDIAFISPDGTKIKRIVGFFGPLGSKDE